jgi:hypothetical protein
LKSESEVSFCSHVTHNEDATQMIAAATDYLTIVSGLPRSGTSMMMKMLECGGLAVMTDEIRTPDDDNPKGYYEFEAVKQTKEDPSWLEGSEGKAVKMVYRLLYDLPTDRKYRVLFMRRNLDEILASQQVMLERHGLADGVNAAQMAALFRSEIDSFYKWVADQSHIELIDVDYNRMQADPAKEVARVNEFLGASLDASAMQSVVDGSLYRNRK